MIEWGIPKTGVQAYARTPVSCPELARPGSAGRAGVEGSGTPSTLVIYRNLFVG